MSKTSLAVLCLSLVAGSGSSGASTETEFTVVVNASRPTTITRQQLADIFLMRATRWSDGTPVIPFDLSVGDPTRQVFSKVVLGQSPESVVYHWRQQLTTKYVKPPLVKSPDDLISVVGSTPGGIGYVVSGTPLPETVKAVTVVEPAR
jgi:ABC-type phosphate transport system substrate-binding protein